MSQALTTCKCRAFFGSVASMKGNEARVVFFLHPVTEFKEGMVSSRTPNKVVYRICFILLTLSIILGLGAVGFVLFTNAKKQFVLLDFFPPSPGSTPRPPPTTITTTTTTTTTATTAMTTTAIPTTTTSSGIREISGQSMLLILPNSFSLVI